MRVSPFSQRRTTAEPEVITAIAHPNIALIKYWGKQPGRENIPATASLSITLDELTTTTRVSFEPAQTEDSFHLNGKPSADARVLACVARFRDLAAAKPDSGVRSPSTQRVAVVSDNNFPTAAGLASSASGFAALTTALNALFETGLESQALSLQSRLGSGSAARSHYGGFCVLDGKPQDSSSWVARPLASATDWPVKVVVAVCSQQQKTVSSRLGMNLTRDTSPFYEGWTETGPRDLEAGTAAVVTRDFDALARVSEHSCLKMHGLMLSADPALIYWNPATLACIHAIRDLRARGTPVFFTIDAGPQLKAVCLPEAVDEVKQALHDIDGVQRLLLVGLGEGARLEQV